MRSDAHSDAARKKAERYSFLASWSNAAGWKRAVFRFTVSLCWSQLYRTEHARVYWDSRDEMTDLSIHR